ELAGMARRARRAAHAATRGGRARGLARRGRRTAAAAPDPADRRRRGRRGRSRRRAALDRSARCSTAARADAVLGRCPPTADLGPALAELERREVDVLVLNGGDGTVQGALTELLRDPQRERLPAVAPLRGGRTNATSTDLGADRDPARGLARLIEAADTGQLG